MFAGVYSLLVTPFTDDNAVDWDVYNELVAHHSEAGVDGIFAVCGTSQMGHLSWDECLGLAARAKEISGVPVVATGNIQNDSALHQKQVVEMAETGVDGVVLVPPPTPLGPEEKRDYYCRLIESNPLPTLFYEYPSRPDSKMPPRLYECMVKNYDIRGIKDTTCNMAEIREKIACRGDSTIFQASTPFLVESLDAGAGGMMAITSAGSPSLAVKFWKAYTRGERKRCELLHYLLVTLDAVLSKAHPHCAQYLLKLQGVHDLKINPRGGKPDLGEDKKRGVEIWWRQTREILDKLE